MPTQRICVNVNYSDDDPGYSSQTFCNALVAVAAAVLATVVAVVAAVVVMAAAVAAAVAARMAVVLVSLSPITCLPQQF